VNQDQIIEWAREAGFKQRLNSQNEWWMLTPDIANFAAIVADHAAKQEREACALVCDEISDDRWAAYKNRPPYEGNETTRYSQHTEGESDGAENCAAAIRAREKKP